MRPVRLDVEGFTAFRSLVTLDLEGADLFALAGPTGAGKSSLLDAMCFALYGTVPRLDRRAVAPVIATGLNEARVRLAFTVGERSYTVARVVRRTKGGGATTKEARLESGDDILAGDADGVTKAVTELLALSFEQFTTCVILPQGEFARFLHDTPAGRQELLVRLLELAVYAQMREGANLRRAAADANRDAAARELSGVTATAQDVEDASARSSALEGLREALEEAQPRLDALDVDRERALRERAEAAAAAARLMRVAVPPQAPDLGGRLAVAAAQAEQAEAAALRAEAAVLAAEQARGELGERGPLERVGVAAAERAELADRLGRGRPIFAAERAAEGGARRARATAAAAVDSAAARLETARRASAAAHLAAPLAVGDPCPVCARPLDGLPPAHPAGDLAAGEAALVAARAAEQAAAERLLEHASRRAAAEAQLEALESRAGVLDTQLGEGPAPQEADRRLAAIAAAEARLRAARDTERAARTRTRERAAELATQRRLQDTAWQAYDTERDALAALDPPRPDRSRLLGAWADLAAWAAAQAPVLAAAAAEAATRADAAIAAHAALGDELTARARDLGITPHPPPAHLATTDPAPRGPRAAAPAVSPGGWGDAATGPVSGTRGLRAACADALAAARALRERLVADLARAEVLRSVVAGQAEAAAVAQTLARHLAANGFERWLLDEALTRLAAGASRRLRELSAGQYSMGIDEQRNFSVVDHHSADERRPARTLSGGETFLAALALALTLADHLAELASGGTPRLEAIFLDEGFGTLDSETLDIVAGALEELGARGRTVGLVTHVRELAERLPVRFEVRKAPGGSQVERVAV